MPGSSFDRVLTAVQATGLRHTIKHGGTHIQAECPTHSDNHPSLTVDYKAGEGCTLLNCQASCDPHDVVAALDLTMPMLFDDYEDLKSFKERRDQEREEERKSGRRTALRTKRTVVAKPRPALPKGRLPARVTRVEPRLLGEWAVAATYDYCDVDGVV
ncbi:MAG: hypothetical protein ACRCYU_04145, partial [Nocardioides sp.]